MTSAHHIKKKINKKIVRRSPRHCLAALVSSFLLCAGTHAVADAAEVGITAEGTLGINVLDDTQLGVIRGRYAPPETLNSDAPIAVILWDEGASPRTGSGSGHQQANGHNNNQRTTLQTSSPR